MSFDIIFDFMINPSCRYSSLRGESVFARKQDIYYFNGLAAEISKLTRSGEGGLAFWFQEVLAEHETMLRLGPGLRGAGVVC